MRTNPTMYEAETDRLNIGLEQFHFKTEKEAVAFIQEECKWEATISGVVRAPLYLGGTVIYMQSGDFRDDHELID